ncbi:MAG: SBBP repeat-containing protein, partial [Limisphaerales bacterium]
MLKCFSGFWFLATLLSSTFAVQAALPETAPEFAWAISAGGKGHDKTRCLAVDARGNIFLTGEFAGTSQFGEHTLTSAWDMDFFVAKCSPDGKFLWARSAGGSGIDRGYGVATDAAGNCYVTGHFQSTNATFSGVAVPNSGDYDIFVAKYDSQGKLAWLKSGGGTGYDYGHGIAADKHGNVFVTGAIVGEGTIGAEPLGHPGPAHVFCLAMNPDGKVNWIRAAEGQGSSSGHGIAADQQGNCYVGGYASGNASFGGQKLTTPTGHDILVAKFDA